MSLKNKDQRVTVFIDVQNLYHSAKHLYQARVNFGEILKAAVAGRKLIRAFAYVIRTKTGEEQPFFDALLKLGIETRVKDLQEYVGGLKKGDWDVGIAVDAIKTSDGIDTVALVSGDGDYVPLLEYLRNRGKRIEVIAFGRSTSTRLREATDEFIDLGENTEKFLLHK
ncbi:MAG: NYN domain-containing protein [Candidatus Wildermuthbacteria bacterium]|nr:NYN domain-containing protein [Candidatus Wildermuthbacteria bacterium]MBI2121475.1 NYN domain-containing protein [Candidatus Wildermuthbacteria bacterium]MBI2648019.1 NYN domain-containing protein [Candidatus Wildermuthbacteria bacterium]